jgi:hypothetical protein
MSKVFNKAFLWLFIVLYTAIAFVSTYHAIAFFALSNPTWLAVVLAIAFEVGQAGVLFSILTNTRKDDKTTLPWILMGILTIVQVLGNVFSSYRYMIIHNTDQIDYFTKSVLFFVQSPNPDYNYVMISYITGAILPVVALCMTSMVVNTLKRQNDTMDYTEEPIKVFDEYDKEPEPEIKQESEPEPQKETRRRRMRVMSNRKEDVIAT